MAEIAKPEMIAIGNTVYEAGRELSNLSRLSMIWHSGKLVVARQIDAQGEFSTMPEPTPYDMDWVGDANDYLLHLHKQIQQTSTVVPVPAAVGFIAAFNTSYFAIKHPLPENRSWRRWQAVPNSTTERKTTLVPYAASDRYLVQRLKPHRH
jgi:hypothetical protein